MKRYNAVKQPVDFSRFPVEVEGKTVRSMEMMDAKWSKSGAICFRGYVEAGKPIIMAIRADQLNLDDYENESADQPIYIFGVEYHGAALWREKEVGQYLTRYIPKYLKVAIKNARIARFMGDYNRLLEICKEATNGTDRDMFLFLRAKSRENENQWAPTPPLYISELSKATEIQVGEDGNKYYNIPSLGWYHLQEGREWANFLKFEQVEALKLEAEIKIIDD